MVVKWGAIALLDCLGFKGIWSRYSAEAVIDRFEEIQQMAGAEAKSFAAQFQSLSAGAVNIQIVLISDTVLISVQYAVADSEVNKHQRRLLVSLVTIAASVVIRMFHEGTPILLLRGCIACGEHVVKGTVFLGPAIDEAAEQMNDADGPFVWLTPSAADAFERFIVRIWILSTLPQAVKEGAEVIIKQRGATLPEGVDMSDLLNVAVPLTASQVFYCNVPRKDKEPVQRLVLNPCVSAEYCGRSEVLAQRWLETMPEANPSLRRKRANTIRFFETLEVNLNGYVQDFTSSIRHVEALGLAPHWPVEWKER